MPSEFSNKIFLLNLAISTADVPNTHMERMWAFGTSAVQIAKSSP